MKLRMSQNYFLGLDREEEPREYTPNIPENLDII